MAMHHGKANSLSLLGLALLPLCAVVLCACGGCGTVERGRTAVAGMATCMDPLSQCGNPWSGMCPLYGYQPTCWHAWPYPMTDCPCVFDAHSDTHPSHT